LIHTPESLSHLINDGKVIKYLSERELNSPEGVGFDLRVSKVSVLTGGGGSLKCDTRRTPEIVNLNANDDGCYVLRKGEVYLVSTMEEFDLPDDLAAFFYPRSTLFRSGVNLASSVLPPGYVGPMTFSLTNHYKKSFELEKGARFAHVVFHSVTGRVGRYKGQWQGGRVSQPNDEEQF
jgi:deoxycytidine triphosphate deaminase